MTKLNRKYAEALAILMVVAVAPASIAFAQTASVDGESNTDVKVGDEKIKAETKANVKANLQAKLVDKLDKRIENIQGKIDKMENAKDNLAKKIANKDDVSASVDVLSRNGTRTDLAFTGQTNGWAIMGGIASKSSISLVGDAHHANGDNWKVNATADMMVGDRNATLNLTGFARNNHIHLVGSGTLGSGDAIKVMLNGNFAPTSDDGVYAVAFTTAGIQHTDGGKRIPLMQVGSVTIVDTTVTTSAQQ